ncbi:hypothetical protein [Nitrosovibrio sp. Nv4]|nr:hypothetical protein [Nitrosovibrio sp. Nv4]SOD41356.1 hypothetical protein SAMN06298226_1651 [Nitrosovibrio sp. Nv4]SOD41365.1 hypothetical protein SAMN06298226_1660 [Nitrosovibrio sp. Nv4]
MSKETWFVVGNIWLAASYGVNDIAAIVVCVLFGVAAFAIASGK